MGRLKPEMTASRSVSAPFFEASMASATELARLSLDVFRQEPSAVLGRNAVTGEMQNLVTGFQNVELVSCSKSTLSLPWPPDALNRF